MTFHATKQHVLNRGIPPDDFLDQLVAWGKTAPDEIFIPNDNTDIYSNVVGVLGPWEDLGHRRAAMLEVMRVLAGFGQELKDLVRAKAGSLAGNDFQRAMKADHPLAMEYIARLLRRTVDHNGPVKRHEIDPWLRKDAVAEFRALLTA